MSLQSLLKKAAFLAVLTCSASASASTVFNTDFTQFTTGGAFNGAVPGPGPGPLLAGGTSILGGADNLVEFLDDTAQSASLFTVGPVTFDGAIAGGAAPFTQPDASLYFSGNSALIVENSASNSLTIDFASPASNVSLYLLNLESAIVTLDFSDDSLSPEVLDLDFTSFLDFIPTFNLFFEAPGELDSLTILNTGSELLGVDNFSFETEVAPIPLPAAAWLFLSAIAGMFGFARRS